MIETILEYAILIGGVFVCLVFYLQYFIQFYGRVMLRKQLKINKINQPDPEELKEAMKFIIDNFGKKKQDKDKKVDEENTNRGMFQ